jgi:iron(III) transport system ATP-binding protein
MTFLELTGVTRRYGDVVAVREVTFSVAAGSRAAIVGPSGSGKTTLLRLIAGFETPDAGRIALGGELLAEPGFSVPPHRRGIGYVAQEGALFPHLTTAENIGFGLPRNSGDRMARIKGLMEQVGLPAAMAERRPHELSGGQQQRVALARAMATQPRLMLLDEPFSALDAGLRDAMRERVGGVLGAAGITAILVTHDQAEALSFSDHLAVMREGMLVQSGPPQELYHNPGDAETARFLGEAVMLDVVLSNGVAPSFLGPLPTNAPGRSGRATVLLRPEQIVVVPVEERERATGIVVERSFRGATCRLSIARLGGSGAPARISVDLPSLLAPEAGTAVRLSVIGAAHVLAGD